VTTITADGTVRTVTATPAPNPTDSSGEAVVENKGGGLGSGAIAGIVVGVVGGLAVVIGVFVWLWCVKRKRQNEAGANGLGSPMRGGSGSLGTMATPNTGDMSESRFGGSDSQKRRSHLMPIDPRLDPFAKGIYASDQNRSRESFSSLQDNQDYSRRVHQPGRVLRATNPDPDVG
jgi:cell wall integrity and stress response component